MHGTSTMLLQLIHPRSMIPSIYGCFPFSIWSPVYIAANRYFLFQKLPIAFRKYFPGNGASTWIVLRHGFRAWPVEVVDFELHEGWDTFREVHHLATEFKVAMSCECKWIFHTALFDESDRELVFKWSAPNLQWQDFHPPPGLFPHIPSPKVAQHIDSQ